MLGNVPFYHKHIKNSIIAFGRVFSNIHIIRENPADPTKNQTLEIPLAYAPKEKWLVRIDQDPTLENQVHTVLPRMSFEINSFSYDPARKLNRMNRVANDSTLSPTVHTRKQTFTPVPYNVEISLYILTKTQEDNLQILEQILPVFTPEYTVKITSVPDLTLENDVPIILNSVAVQDDYEGDFQTRRFVTTTLTFTLKLNLYRDVTDAKIITKTIQKFEAVSNIGVAGQSETLTSTGTVPGAPITDAWTHNW